MPVCGFKIDRSSWTFLRLWSHGAGALNPVDVFDNVCSTFFSGLRQPPIYLVFGEKWDFDYRLQNVIAGLGHFYCPDFGK